MIALYGEHSMIRAVCPEGQTFAAFVRAWRGPNATIRVTRGRL